MGPLEKKRGFQDVTLGEAYPYVAWMLELEDCPAICFVVNVDDLAEFFEKVAVLVTNIVTHARKTYTHWEEWSCMTCLLQPGLKEYRLQPYEGVEQEPRAIALDVLRSHSYTFGLEIGGTSYEVTQFAPDPETLVGDYVVRHEGKQFEFATMHHDLPELRKAIALAGLAAAADAGLYAGELYVALEAGNALLAYRSFCYLVSLGADADKLVDSSEAVLKLLMSAHLWDFADSVAARAITLCRPLDKPELELRLLHLGGINSSHMGSFDLTCRYFEMALERENASTDQWQAALIRMSYGLALVGLFAHWELEKKRLGGELDPLLANKLSVAKKHLETAKAMFESTSGDRAARNSCVIKLDLIRILDLSGEHAEALSRLDDVLRTDDFFGEPNLRATALAYRLATLWTLAQDDETILASYMDEAKSISGQMNALGNQRTYPDRLCWVCALIGEPLLEAAAVARVGTDSVPLEILESSVLPNLKLAYKLQRSFSAGNIRPPMPDATFGGIGAIDIAGRLQLCYLVLADARSDSTIAWEAFCTADEAKGRFFRRDIGFAPARLEGQLKPHVRDKYAQLRQAVAHGGGDPRFLIAEYDWLLRNDLSEEAAMSIREETDFDSRISFEEVVSWLPERTALICFFGMAEETFCYVVRREAPHLGICRMIMTLRELHVRVREVPVRSSNVESAEELPEHLAMLRDDLSRSVMPSLDDVDQVVIVPHGLWHELPLGAVMLPLFWQQGRSVGVRFAPSVRAAMLLDKRASASKPLELQTVGLATVPAKENKEKNFKNAHEELVRIFSGDGRPVLEKYGEEATADRILADLLDSGVAHALAHGKWKVGHEAMQSGLLLAESSGLPSRFSEKASLSAAALMANGTSARHITLQACSTGRSERALGDELWGLPRGLIAAGANSVLAPLWDVRIRSSTRLLRQFYENWLLSGEDKALALSEAQRAMWKGDFGSNWRHFSHWGAFQLVGC